MFLKEHRLWNEGRNKTWKQNEIKSGVGLQNMDENNKCNICKLQIQLSFLGERVPDNKRNMHVFSSNKLWHEHESSVHRKTAFFVVFTVESLQLALVGIFHPCLQMETEGVKCADAQQSSKRSKCRAYCEAPVEPSHMEEGVPCLAFEFPGAFCPIGRLCGRLATKGSSVVLSKVESRAVMIPGGVADSCGPQCEPAP